jgi:hypothetical protein
MPTVPQSNLLVDVHCQIMHLNNSCWKLQLHAYQLCLLSEHPDFTIIYILQRIFIAVKRYAHSVWRQPQKVDCGDGVAIYCELWAEPAPLVTAASSMYVFRTTAGRRHKWISCAEEIKWNTEMSVTHEIQDQEHYVVRSVVLYRRYCIIGDCTMMCYSFISLYTLAATQ